MIQNWTKLNLAKTLQSTAICLRMLQITFQKSLRLKEKRKKRSLKISKFYCLKGLRNQTENIEFRKYGLLKYMNYELHRTLINEKGGQILQSKM